MLENNIKLVNKLRNLVESSTQTKAALQCLQVLEANDDETLANAMLAYSEKNLYILDALLNSKTSITISATMANSKEGAFSAINFTVLVKPTNELETRLGKVSVIEYPVLIIKFAKELIEIDYTEQSTTVVDAEVFFG
jgi:replicative DNA helicase